MISEPRPNSFSWALPLYYQLLGSSTAGYQAIAKVVRGITYHSTSLPDWRLDHWGFGFSKISQLERNYLDPSEIARVKRILTKRSPSKYTSVALALRGVEKESRSQGWCMLAVVFSRVSSRYHIEVHYRTTEIIRKFAADIWFLRERILPRIIDLRSPGVIEDYTFRFTNCSISGVNFPYLVDKLDLVDFLKDVERMDPEFFRRTTRFLLKSSYKQDQFHPYSGQRLSHNYLWENGSESIPQIRHHLEDIYVRAGRALPRDFHKKDTYITKRLRNEEEEEE